MFRYFLLWLPMLALAIINGTLRDLWYKKYINDLTAQQLSTVSLILLLGIYVWLVMSRLPLPSMQQAIYVGLLWMSLTLLFEFGFGMLRGNSLSAMLADYNIFEGRLWVLIPLWIFILPYLCRLTAHNA